MWGSSVQMHFPHTVVRRTSVGSSLSLYVCLSVHPSVCLSICPSVRLSVCRSIHPSRCLSICLLVHLSVCLSISLSGCQRHFLMIICAARNCVQCMQPQATGLDPLIGSIIFPSVRPSSNPQASCDFCICINFQCGVPAL